MDRSRRTVLKSILAATAAGSAARSATNGPFEANWESLKQYRCPDWFRDAKFGMWSHWGPQGAPKQGDWYARNIYIQGTRHYKHHLQHYGHPSKVGYKDIIPLWTGKNWEPETLIRKYKKAGAKYFVSLGVHCDNFDCWNSKHHSWNAVNHGPKKDVVATWRKIARDNGLRFGVSEHLAWSYSWFNVNKNADKEGSLAGVPYDGANPKYQELYFAPHAENSANYSINPTDWWKQNWLQRITDLVDQHRPDFVYTDGGAFGDVGLQLIAHYYNQNIQWHKGKLEGVYTLKNHRDQVKFGQYQEGATLLDVERGVVAGIHPQPFNTDTCIGQWQYYEGFPYKKSRQIIEMLVDVVSRNGNLLLSVPQLPDGTLDSHCEGVVDDITRWMASNGEAIFATQPWKVCGEGPLLTQYKNRMFSERNAKQFTPEDVRFTQKGDTLYAFCTPAPDRGFTIQSLGAKENMFPRPIKRVTMLGSGEKLVWTQNETALVVDRPKSIRFPYAVALKVEG